MHAILRPKQEEIYWKEKNVGSIFRALTRFNQYQLVFVVENWAIKEWQENVRNSHVRSRQGTSPRWSWLVVIDRLCIHFVCTPKGKQVNNEHSVTI